jgi:YVTN family beta-propeller protein
MMTSLQRLSFYNKSWRKFSLKKLLVIVLFFVVLVSFTNYAYGITVGTFPFEVAINPTTERAYVSHADGTVHVIDTTTDTDIATIPVSPGNALLGIAVNPATNKIYVANSGTNQVAVIDGGTNTVSTTINLAPAGVFPVDVEVNTVTNSLYVSNVLSLVVLVIDITPGSPFENQIIDVITGFFSPSRFTFDPNTNLMYMTNFFTNQVSVLDGSQNALSGGNPVLPSITIGNSADGIEINPTNQKIYTANSGDDTVSVIDANPSSGTYNTLIATITVGVNPVGEIGRASCRERV